jgi:SAM-dependent methyltransferase
MSRAVIDEELRRRRDHFEIERELADRLRDASKERRRTLYAEVYEELFRRVEIPGNVEAQRAQVELLAALVAPFVDRGTRFLEIGAGACDLSLALARDLERVWAVDALDPRIDPATAPRGFAFVPADRLSEVVPRGQVDVALSCHFVEHLHPDDLADHLDQMLDVLAEGGRYIVVTPNRIYGPHDISRGFAFRAEGLHLREYTHFDLARRVRRTGFSEVRVIGRIGEAPRGRGLLLSIGLVERVLDALPGRLRLRLTDRAPRKPPFRPLEQIKLVATK